MQERLQKILAKAGICSRRAAEEFIKQGKVKVDGKVISEMGLKLNPDKHKIEFKGKLVEFTENKISILLNKPKGYVTTLSDPQGRPIVTELLPDITERVFPVGRLDLDTEGALILTNDGALADRITHPRFEIAKTYIAKVNGHPTRKKIALLEKGVEIDEQKTAPAKLKVLTTKAGHSEIQVIIHEGKKRQVRKMFAAVGHRVLALKRTSYGSLKLGKTPVGKFRILSDKELAKIFI